ncbi:MAG: hypothetical protein AVDCRST_MAG87-606, partial [uncultured Thermomicrobiales bacterium]
APRARLTPDRQDAGLRPAGQDPSCPTLSSHPLRPPRHDCGDHPPRPRLPGPLHDRGL